LTALKKRFLSQNNSFALTSLPYVIKYDAPNIPKHTPRKAKDRVPTQWEKSPKIQSEGVRY